MMIPYSDLKIVRPVRIAGMSPKTPVRIVGVAGTRPRPISQPAHHLTASSVQPPYGHDCRAHAGSNTSTQGSFVKFRVAIVSTVFAVLTASAAQAQGIPGGAAHGFYEGNRRAGPVGAVVGGAVGGVIGGV